MRAIQIVPICKQGTTRDHADVAKFQVPSPKKLMLLSCLQSTRAVKKASTSVLPIQIFRTISSASRPYIFHVGASWAGMKKAHIRFPPESAIAEFRDRTLSRRTLINSGDAGQDFFYVGNVRQNACQVLLLSISC